MRHPCCWPRLPVQRRKFTALPILTLGKSPSPPTGLTVAIPSSTSSTVDGSWNTGEKVALKVDGDDATYTYTVENSQGAMSGDYYWQSTAPITVQGFYPYEAGANQYEVWDAAGLDVWADLVRRGNGNAGCKLLADITYDSPKEWEPIGNYYLHYSGTFDGNGKTISNITTVPKLCYHYCMLDGVPAFLFSTDAHWRNSGGQFRQRHDCLLLAE